ncbi:MAG: GNAT family N-acetyltransferase [Deltaproteobacteria bacterium]|nr:GNAT family N-acetyltransferase [Deltaproteobacteria bacterium]
MPQYTFLTHPTPSHIEQILDLYTAAGWWERGPDDAALIKKLIAGSHCFLIAEFHDRLIGMGRVVSDGVSDAYIQDVTVLDEYRSQGIATGIVTRLLRRLQADRIDWIGLIAEGNTHDFYARLGFTQMTDSAPMVYKKT